MKRLQDLEQLKKLFVGKDGDVNNIPMVSPSKTVQAVLDENGRSVIIKGTLGTYLALLFPNDSTHTTIRFYQTIYGSSSKITGPVLNNASLSTAYNASIAETYDTASEDITHLFNDYVNSLTALGFTNISFTKPMIMRRTGNNRTITGVLKFDNPTENAILIPSSLTLCTLSSLDCISQLDWTAIDICDYGGNILTQIIDRTGHLANLAGANIAPGVNRYVSFNFDYSI